MYHLGGQRGAIQEAFPGAAALVAVTLLIRRKALRRVAVLVHLPDLFQGLLHLGLHLHHERTTLLGRSSLSLSVAKSLKLY